MLGASVDSGKIDGVRPIWKRVNLDAAAITAPEFAGRVKSAEPPSKAIIEGLSSLLNFKYKYIDAAGLPAKISVSALKEGEEDGDAMPADFIAQRELKLRRPLFIEGNPPVTGAMLGSAYHAIMESIDFNAPPSPQIDAMADKGIISPELRKLVKDERITALLNSPLGRKMKAAKRIWREAPFMINIPAEEAFGEAPSGEYVAVQGIIDCFFEYNGEIILVDYKTDSYSKPEELVQKYKKQLYYYTKAIKMKFSDKKIQKYLYLFHKGDIIEVS